MTQIRDILRGRSDLSAFLVHFTRGDDPEANIKSMLTNMRIDALNAHGWGQATLSAAGVNAVCFTETPLEFLSLLCGPIQGRNVQLSEWGPAFSKYQARLLGVNPVMYAQGFPNQFGGARQPANALDSILQALNAHLSGATPLSVGMQSAFEMLLASASRMQRQGGANEWWWEREWRRVGDFSFLANQVAFGLCPRSAIAAMENWTMAQTGRAIRFVSPSWTIEETVSHLAQVPEDNPPWPAPRY